MLDFATYHSAQHLTYDLAHSARPSAPIVPAGDTAPRTPRALLPRQVASRFLRYLADLIEPPIVPQDPLEPLVGY